MGEMLRFFTVTVLGVVVDIAIAYTLHELAGVPLALAALIGFVCAASANYVLHQVWSFGGGMRSLSGARAAKYAVVAGLTLLVRVSVVAVLDAWLVGGFALLILICGAGVSFFVNFALSKLFVFAQAPAGEGTL
ncbi:GtrA family protein [Qipengyuania sp. S6317L1]|uniref:GtrA family protein n=1 Tax=Qipengyuania sp. S6317L1 TaxID=2926410 RepID=UPI001FF46916|nr:GtrA family protein [Qipengyuania sp. S6317L1]MCK0098214.1 GtrA family protein [Qipengyuania sp. S6317L1]